MNINEIRALAELMVECGLDSLKIEDGDYQVSMSRPGTVTVQQTFAAEPVAAAPAVVSAVAPAALEQSAAATTEARNVVTSPIVGVYYQSSSPEAEPFVKVGQRVSKGDVLCIVEAMKMMNEITSDFDGEIAEILVQDGQVVEYGQALFALVD